MKKGLLYTLALLFASIQAYAQIYTYDANNKLTKVEYGNGVTVSYEYDVLGNRTSKTVSGVTAQSFKVTVKASPKEYGSVDGGGTYSEGTNVELNAVASVGFEFEKWSDGPTDNPRAISVTKDVSYTALFKVKEKNQEESGGEIGPGGVDLGIYDTNGDGVVNQYDLDAIIDAYLEDAPATPSTDVDDDGEITIADISMMVAIMNDMHTGEYNGHEYVDLGLPSGTLWATCNLGATSSEESGCYYAWGETTGSCEGKTDFSWRNYKYCNGLIGEGLTKYNNDPELGYEGYTDDLETLEPADDAATANWGGKWRMPTRQEINELRNKQYTKWTFATHNGVKGFVITSIVKGYVGNSIFLPAEGGFYDGRSLDYKGEYSYYWASTAFLNSYGDYAKSIVLRASGTHGDGFRYRCEGLSIRPVVNLGEIATGSDPDLSNGLVAYYPFNGNANDESGHGNHGTPMSSVTLTTGVNGDANSAYKFGGCDNPGNIHIPNSESLIIDDSWSFATFVKPTSYTGMDGWGRKSTTDGTHAIMGKDHDQSGFSIQYRLNSDSLHVWLGCTSGWTKDFGASIYGNYLNQWVHVSITYSNSTFKVYLNGQKRAEAKIQANFSVANTKDLYLGKYRDSWYPMDGVLDEVRIYNRALSVDEIKQLAGEVNLNCPVAEAIDLGLPSGTKWASWNIGASKPEEYGGYYAWGETEEKYVYTESTYKYYNSETGKYIHIGDDIAGTEYDVAHVKWGGSWCMPTMAQLDELRENCTREWAQQNGVNGIRVTGPNGNSIFLPAAGSRWGGDLYDEGSYGYYWSSSLYSDREHLARGLYFNSIDWDWYDTNSKNGLSVRAVCPSTPPSSTNITFADAAVKAICVANWDTNKDGELSYGEAAAVKSLGEVFYEKQGISSFNELQYFTGLTIIEEEAFRECSLESVSIPKGVKTIGEKAFMQCPNLSEVTLPEGVTWIDEEAFAECALTSITLPESLIRLGEQALEENPLISVTLPRNVAYLGNSDEDDLYGGVFDYCYSLKEVNVDESNETYASIEGVLTTKDKKILLFFPYAKGDGYKVPEGIEQIHYDAFNECKNTSVTLPSTLKSFYTDEDEENYSAFSNNFDLRTVRAKMKEPFECGYLSFSSETYSSGTLHVPQGTKALYETTAGWSRFQNIVEEDGDQCLKMTTTAPGENDWDYQLNYTLPQPLQAGKTYNVSITAKATNGLESIPFWPCDPQGAALYTGFRGLPADGDMTTLWLTFTAEADYKYLQFALGKLDGDFFLDDFVVTEAGSDINLVANGNFDEEVVLKDVEWQEDGNVPGNTWWKYSWINFTVGMDTLKRESFTIEWVDQLTNGEMAEGRSMENFIVLEPGKPYLPGTPIPGGPDGKNCIKITSIDNPTNSWDTQFFIYTPDKAWTAGENYKISFWYRASQNAVCDTQCHYDPGFYLHWQMLPNAPNFTTEWQYYEAQGIIPDEGDGMHAIAFNLNVSDVSTDYYFADIHWCSMEKRFESASY